MTSWLPSGGTVIAFTPQRHWFNNELLNGRVWHEPLWEYMLTAKDNIANGAEVLNNFILNNQGNPAFPLPWIFFGHSMAGEAIDYWGHKYSEISTLSTDPAKTRFVIAADPENPDTGITRVPKPPSPQPTYFGRKGWDNPRYETLRIWRQYDLFADCPNAKKPTFASTLNVLLNGFIVHLDYFRVSTDPEHQTNVSWKLGKVTNILSRTDNLMIDRYQVERGYVRPFPLYPLPPDPPDVPPDLPGVRGHPYTVREEDRFRYIIEEARTGKILARDLLVEEPQLMRKLSGPSAIEFKLDPRSTAVWSEDGLPFPLKPWGHWCHAEKLIRGEWKIWASGLFQPSDVDPKTGKLSARFEGFSNYPSKMPWLENWNPIAVDPFEIFKRVWTHLQSYPNGNLGVEVYPDASGVQMLPGFSFDGEEFIQDFFAIFIRAIDTVDSGDYINKLARDIPFDYFEESSWNSDYTAISKKIKLAYPSGGAKQDNLLFQFGSNVLDGKTKIESEIQWASDIIVRGWFPGKVYSSQIGNADPKRFRRVVMEEDARINSNERTQAWSKRQLQRRQFPRQWESIIVDMYHPNAPFGSYDVGDKIIIEGEMPWYGEVSEEHKILAISVDDAKSQCQLMVRAEGAFNYDPITYVPAGS